MFDVPNSDSDYENIDAAKYLDLAHNQQLSRKEGFCVLRNIRVTIQLFTTCNLHDSGPLTKLANILILEKMWDLWVRL